MKGLFSTKALLILLLLAFSCVVVWMLLPEDEIDYNTQVKPIINQNCIACHGGVKQSGGFSLLFEEEAKGNTKSDKPAIIPGHPEESEMIHRLVSHDPEERMPYEKPPLSQEDIDVLKKWIAQGAKWGTHWAYKSVEKVDVGDQFSDDNIFTKWKNNDIDYFIYKKLKEQELDVSPVAQTPDLTRRISLDLIGLPPPSSIFEKTVKNPSNDGLDVYIDELMASPHFGEKWAGMWMDLARYSDTKGYERDAPRTIWKYRDWLIKAFNEDKPYDVFLTEQIAGDMLPNPTDDQLIATAFHRNTMTNDEGGTNNEEFRVAAVIDRVNTTWEVTMGTTFACVQCHSHPYDPFKHDDYYRFMDFFNNSRDEDTFDDYPVLREFKPQDSTRLVELKNWLHKNADQEQADEVIKFVKTMQPSINSLTADNFINAELSDTKWLVLRNNSSNRFGQVGLDGKNTLIYKYQSYLPGGVWQVRLDDVNGPLLKEVKLPKTKGWDFAEFSFEKVEGAHDIYFTYRNPNLTNPRSNGLKFDWLYFADEFPGRNSNGYRKAKNDFWELMETRTFQTPIMVENPPEMKRETKVFDRGNWLSKGALVTAGVPEVMNDLPDGAPTNRLGLAKWLVSPQNPLTARTYVNRIWEQLFGFGIVETLEDFGTQGIPPTHQELLDHLAWKFMHDFDWSTKKLLKYIVSSAVYQQSSYSNPKQLQKDPQNKYHARGPRIRLSAEQIRDQSLAVSGLLSEKMYGPSVMPYQPDGIWNSPYSGLKWVKSEGEDQYRRALYTYWKRTGPYPSMTLFDMMPREVCTIRRISTNTPLQALVTLNDSSYVEAALHFAKRMITEGGSQPSEQIAYGYKLMMYKDIPQEKLQVLLGLYDGLTKEELIKNVAYKEESQIDKQLNAMGVVANTMMNLDEFIMKN